MTDLFLNAYKGYAPKEAGALSYYAKALAHTGLLRKNGRKFGMRALKKLSFNERRDLLKALKKDVLSSKSLPNSHRNNLLLSDLRGAAHNYYNAFAKANITPPTDIHDYYRRLQDMNRMSTLRGAWTPFNNGASQFVTMYNAPFLQGVKQPKMTTPESFTIN